MHEELRNVATHIKELGLAALSHAQQHTLYSDPANPFWNELAVLQAAHAAEILIKARIAEQHPLLIFTDLPRSSQVTDTLLNIEALIEAGRTIQYQDLPERLWATTGYKINDLELYQRFGKLRNSIQHFASPLDRDIHQETIKFIYMIIEPLIFDAWGLYAVNFIEDPDAHDHIFPSLLRAGVRFLIPEECEEIVENEIAAHRLYARGADLVKLDIPTLIVACKAENAQLHRRMSNDDVLRIKHKIRVELNVSESAANSIYYAAIDLIEWNYPYNEWWFL